MGAPNAFASSARFFEEALELGIPEEERADVLFSLGAALHRSGHERRVERLEEARDALLAAGDPEKAAEACVLLAEAWWDQGQNDRGRVRLERARELVRDRPASPSAERVLVEVSRYAMLADQTDEAIPSGREAVEIAEALGLAELVPSALINIGSARGNSGDQAGGTADLERAIEIARETNHPDLGRAYNNLATMQDNFDRAYELQLRGKEAADRLGNAPVARFIEGQLMLSAFDLGRWDDFMRAADEFIAACEAGSPTTPSHIRASVGLTSCWPATSSNAPPWTLLARSNSHVRRRIRRHSNRRCPFKSGLTWPVGGWPKPGRRRPSCCRCSRRRTRASDR